MFSELHNYVFYNGMVKAYATNSSTKKTCLYDFHNENGAKMVEFAGYFMPVLYKDLSLANSHLHTRSNCSLFDVSHMLQTVIKGKDRIKFLESLVTADLESLQDNCGTLTVFTNESGGIKDDLIVNKSGDLLFIVSNAACAEKDKQHLKAHADLFRGMGKEIDIEHLDDRCLIALQGPNAAALLSPNVNFDLNSLFFMHSYPSANIFGIKDCRVSRCGYTGEDGFEISVEPSLGVELVKRLLSEKNGNCHLAGLGARDSLRLEAGLCLYGNDIDENTTPVEAGLTWLIAKRRRQLADFPGSSVILEQIKNKPKRKRVGIICQKGRPPRQGAKLLHPNEIDSVIGNITSGCPSPSLKYNIAMGYISAEQSEIGNVVKIDVSGGKLNAPSTPGSIIEGEIVKMPFVPSRYYTRK